MKKLLLVLMIGCETGLAYSQPHKLEALICGDNTSRVRVILDSSPFKPGSGYKKAVNANLMHMYSTVQDMTCIGIVKDNSYNLKCAGYYNSIDELTEVAIRNVDDKIMAFWTTAIYYGSLKKQTACKLVTMENQNERN